MLKLSDAADLANRMNQQWVEITKRLVAVGRPVGRFGGGYFIGRIVRNQIQGNAGWQDQIMNLLGSVQYNPTLGEALMLWGELQTRVFVIGYIGNIEVTLKLTMEDNGLKYVLGQSKKRRWGAFAARVDGIGPEIELNRMRIRIPHD